MKDGKLGVCCFIRLKEKWLIGYMKCSVVVDGMYYFKIGYRTYILGNTIEVHKHK